MEVMKLIVERPLPIRLSARPDFSDALAPPNGSSSFCVPTAK